MTYLLKLKRTRNGTTTTHTVFAESYTEGQLGITVMFGEKRYWLTGVSITEATEIPTPVTPESTFNNKFILERLEKE